MKITTAFLRDVMNQHLRDEISFSRMVELINEKAAEKEPFKICVYTTICGSRPINYKCPKTKKCYQDEGYA